MINYEAICKNSDCKNFNVPINITTTEDARVICGLCGSTILNEPEPSAEQAMISIRRKRDLLLAKSDWTQVIDSPVDQQAWADYRQALRDLPANITDYKNTVWPVAPGAN